MLTTLIPMIAQIVVSTSAGVAVDSAVKMIVPIGIKALPSFGIKIGTAIASAMIGIKLGHLAETSLKELIDEVQSTEAEEVPAQEDN